jgi:tetratricopeptide (TPR) repeat protein
MGKISCPNCKKKIPIDSITCPKCLLPIKKERVEKRDIERHEQDSDFKFLSIVELKKIQEKLRGALTKASAFRGPIVTVEIRRYPPLILREDDFDSNLRTAVNRADDFVSQGKYKEIGQYEDAIQNLDIALKIMYDNHPYYQNGEPHDLKHLNGVNTFAKILFDRALALKKNLSFDIAILNLDILLEEQLIDDMLRANSWILKGNAYNELKKYNNAMECYNRALEIDPDNELAQANKKSLFQDMGQG